MIDLLNSGPAALDQNYQHQDKQNASDNTDNCCCVHCDTLSRLNQVTLTERAQKPRVSCELLHTGAAALDQDAQNQDEKHAGDDTNHSSVVHLVSLLQLVTEK
jgi:hypothetical protein